MRPELLSLFSVATPGAARAQKVDGELENNWSETMVTAIATTIAVLIVGTVAVLMGLA